MTSGLQYQAPPAPLAVDGVGPKVRFSVIVPVHQSAAVVGEALESLHAQTRPPDEIIVSDDGSTDSLEEALEPFHGRIVVARGVNAGPSAARNRALAVATGDFVAGLDADDLYLPERLERLEELARARPDLDVLATDALLESGDRTIGRFGELTPFSTDAQRLDVFDRCFAVAPAIRRTRLLAVGGFDESFRMGEDWEVLIRRVLTGCSVGLVNEPLYRYRLHADSATSNRLEALRVRVAVLTSFRGRPGLSAAERRALESAIAHRRRAVLRAEAELALLDSSHQARQASLRLALGRGVRRRERAAALVWAIAPRLGRARLARASLTSAPPWTRGAAP